MHGTCARFNLIFLPPLLSLPSLTTPTISTALVISTALAVLSVSTVLTASFLVPVTGVEVAKTDTGFLSHFIKDIW